MPDRKAHGSTGSAALPWHALSSGTFKGQAEPEEEAGFGVLKERKVSNMHTYTHTSSFLGKSSILAGLSNLTIILHNLEDFGAQ